MEDAMEEAVLDALRKSPMSNVDLRIELGLSELEYHQTLDRSLQSLRRQGKIGYESKKWMLSAQKTCTHCGGKGWIDG